MTIKIVTPNRNKHDFDYSGAFKIEADRLVKFYSKWELKPFICRIELDYDIDASGFQNVIESEVDWLIFLCHGGQNWIFKSQFTPDKIEYTKCVAKIVTVFACSAGKNENGPCHLLSKSKNIEWVDSHSNAGHTTGNPNVVRWLQGGKRIDLRPILQDEGLDSLWIDKLKDRERDTFRFQFPLSTVDEIISDLKKFGQS